MAQAALAETALFLPAIYYQYPYPTIFGIETSSMASASLASIAQAGAYFVRLAPFSWKDIEPVRTTRLPITGDGQRGGFEGGQHQRPAGHRYH